MENVVKVGATLETVRTLKDGSFKMSFESGELPAEEGTKLLLLRKEIGWLIFAPTGREMDIIIPTEPPKEFKQDKSPSQRLRAVLYIWWQQSGGEGDFETSYRQKMETIITWVKGKLDE